MRRVHVVPVIAAGLAMFLSACTTVPEAYKAAPAIECPSGSECYDPPKPQGPGGELTVEGGEFFFEVLEGAETVQEGEVKITLNNVGGAEHNFTIDEAFGEVDRVLPDSNVPPGESGEATLELFAGNYVFYCSVPGHRSAGMEGTLTVAPASGGAIAPDAGPGGTGTETEEDEQEDVGEEPAAPGEAGPSPAAPEPTETES